MISISAISAAPSCPLSATSGLPHVMVRRNTQKIASALASMSAVLNGLTRGLDVESTIYIWNKLRERCLQGTSILFVSSDLEEILQYSDKVMVFFAGRVSPMMPAESLTVRRLGELGPRVLRVAGLIGVVALAGSVALAWRRPGGAAARRAAAGRGCRRSACRR